MKKIISFETYQKSWNKNCLKNTLSSPLKCTFSFTTFINFTLKISWDHKRLPWVHLIGCQGVKLFLPKDFLSNKKFLHNLSFWVLSEFEFAVSSVLKLNFVTIWVFECRLLRAPKKTSLLLTGKFWNLRGFHLVVVSRSDTENKSTQQHVEGKKVYTEKDQASILLQGMGTGCRGDTQQTTDQHCNL